MALLMLLFCSCEKELKEVVYSDFTTSDFFKDVKSAEQALWGVYEVLAWDKLYGQHSLLYMPGNDTERFARQDRGNPDDMLANYQIYEDNRYVGTIWQALYTGINRANVVIDKVKTLRDKTSVEADQKALDLVIGEARFLRGFMYFQLVRNWGDVPLKLSSVVVLDDLQSQRTPKESVYQQIEKDLLAAIEVLPEASKVSNAAKINKGAARGILARIYLSWAGFPVQDTSKFAKAAEQALAVVNSGEHALNPKIEKLSIGAPFDQPFPQVFKNLADKVYDLKESMWEIHFSFGIGTRFDASTVGIWHGIIQDTRSKYKRGDPRRYALPTFYDSFEVDDTLRRDWSISQFKIDKDDQFVAEDRNRLRWGVGKFRRYLIQNPSPDNNFDVMNWPVIRYADVLLMLAESINETSANGGTLPKGATMDKAYEATNRVRRRARNLDPNLPNPTVDLKGGGGSDFRQQIRNERKWELCFENQRRHDLIRWGNLVEAIKATGEAMAKAKYTWPHAYFPAKNIEDKHVLLPIPFAAEISQNPDILKTDASNNGYR